MGNWFCWRRILFSLITLTALQSMGLPAFASACAETPEAAVRLAETKRVPSSMPEDKGYRVASVRWDPVLQQSWVTVVSCDHPQWPGVLLRTDDEMGNVHPGLSAQAREAQTPLVRAGDVVELWRQEDLLRIEVSGVAEQSGVMGQTIRVRLLRQQGSSQSADEEFNGVVRGPADVEMQR